MEVILIEEVVNLGNPGDIVNVKSGYASNYLIPQKLGVMKSPAALKILEKQKEEFAKKIEEKKKIYQEQIEKIKEIEELVIPVKASKEGKIFGAVTPQLIQKHLEDNHSVVVDKRRIVIRNVIKTVDIYEVEVVLNSEFKATLKLNLKATI